ncbi:TRM11 family SAM-dependent methyltransferase [Sphingomicrobium flavum]|uniref:TRM11 family SAM-dependent methyltransferase n=1 Tax=Sphingomicrobium flavum TaxID=1229164 RepID=UPI0021AD65DF|nr:DNA methyltransferase [Sphingomicrobium flavum]
MALAFWGLSIMQHVAADIHRLANAAHDQSRVQGATHRFYRYPARFSPQFVNAAIQQFSKPGDLVFDPFVGGGTTAVEAMRLGRDVVGTDINELALFVSEVKTTRLPRTEIVRLKAWANEIPTLINLQRKVVFDEGRDENGYFRNLNVHGAWRHQKAIQQVLDSISEMKRAKTQNFARCALLRTAQVALDGKKKPSTIEQFRDKLQSNTIEMLQDLEFLEEELAAVGRIGSVSLAKRKAQDAARSKLLQGRAPKLVVTSPPYPGVHVLYHRWQIGGRRETPAPYWIANKMDGDGERYYTLGNRHEKGLATYFDNATASFKAVAQIADQDTIIVQMVAFSQPEWQLPKYLEAMQNAGLAEIDHWDKQDRLWRDVPNRKWYAQMQPNQSSSKELVLVHRLAH